MKIKITTTTITTTVTMITIVPKIADCNKSNNSRVYSLPLPKSSVSVM